MACNIAVSAESVTSELPRRREGFVTKARRYIAGKMLEPLLESGMVRSAKTCSFAMGPENSIFHSVIKQARSANCIEEFLNVMMIANEFSLDQRQIMDVVLIRIVKCQSDGPYILNRLDFQYLDKLHRLKHLTLPQIEEAGREYGWVKEMKEAALSLKALAYPTVLDDLSMINIIEEWGKGI